MIISICYSSSYATVGVSFRFTFDWFYQLSGGKVQKKRLTKWLASVFFLKFPIRESKVWIMHSPCSEFISFKRT